MLGHVANSLTNNQQIPQIRDVENHTHVHAAFMYMGSCVTPIYREGQYTKLQD